MTDRNTLEKKMSFPHEYPPTKLMFIPDDVYLLSIRAMNDPTS